MNPEVETNEFVDENLDATGSDSSLNDGIREEATNVVEGSVGDVEGATSEEKAKTPEEQIVSLQAEVAEWKDRALRRQAEAENVKKSAFKEKMEVRKYAMRGFVEDMLRVADTFKLALSTSNEETAAISESHRNLLSGIDMTFKELLQVFERHGVVEIKAEPGLAFDPSLHEAIGRVASDQPADTIAQVARSGWKMGDYVLRGAMVAVSTGPEQEDSAITGGEVDESAKATNEHSAVESEENSSNQ